MNIRAKKMNKTNDKKDKKVKKNINTVLIADDNDGIVASLSMVLTYGGYEVTSTMNGETVKDMSAPFPDLILLDIHMGDVDGLSVCAHLKSRNDTKDIPIVMISAAPHARASALNAGADDFIEKPYSMDEMLDAVGKQLMAR